MHDDSMSRFDALWSASVIQYKITVDPRGVLVDIKGY